MTAILRNIGVGSAKPTGGVQFGNKFFLTYEDRRPLVVMAGHSDNRLKVYDAGIKPPTTAPKIGFQWDNYINNGACSSDAEWIKETAEWAYNTNKYTFTATSADDQTRKLYQRGKVIEGNRYKITYAVANITGTGTLVTAFAGAQENGTPKVAVDSNGEEVTWHSTNGEYTDTVVAGSDGTVGIAIFTTNTSAGCDILSPGNYASPANYRQIEVIEITALDANGTAKLTANQTLSVAYAYYSSKRVTCSRLSPPRNFSTGANARPLAIYDFDYPRDDPAGQDIDKIIVAVRWGELDGKMCIWPDMVLDVTNNGTNLRSATYAWTVSGSGTAEYYVRLAAGTNPSLALPRLLWINNESAAAGTLGSLAAGQWAYGDNDSLGYSTVYVRLSDGTDPDSKAEGYVYLNSKQADFNIWECLQGDKFTNSGFATDTDWIKDTGWTIGSSKATFASTTDITKIKTIFQSFALKPGLRYRVRFTVSGLTGNARVAPFLGYKRENGVHGQTAYKYNLTDTGIVDWKSANGAYSFSVQAGYQSTTGWRVGFACRTTANGDAISIDTVSIEEMIYGTALKFDESNNVLAQGFNMTVADPYFEVPPAVKYIEKYGEKLWLGGARRHIDFTGSSVALTIGQAWRGGTYTKAVISGTVLWDDSHLHTSLYVAGRYLGEIYDIQNPQVAYLDVDLAANVAETTDFYCVGHNDRIWPTSYHNLFIGNIPIAFPESINLADRMLLAATLDEGSQLEGLRASQERLSIIFNDCVVNLNGVDDPANPSTYELRVDYGRTGAIAPRSIIKDQAGAIVYWGEEGPIRATTAGLESIAFDLNVNLFSKGGRWMALADNPNVVMCYSRAHDGYIFANITIDGTASHWGLISLRPQYGLWLFDGQAVTSNLLEYGDANGQGVVLAGDAYQGRVKRLLDPTARTQSAADAVFLDLGAATDTAAAFNWTWRGGWVSRPDGLPYALSMLRLLGLILPGASLNLSVTHWWNNFPVRDEDDLAAGNQRTITVTDTDLTQTLNVPMPAAMGRYHSVEILAASTSGVDSTQDLRRTVEVPRYQLIGEEEQRKRQ